MPKRPYDMPPLAALSCFEAAARQQSFKTAAQELNVTPAAVSHRIKALEFELGVPLFRRHHRGVELTESGAWLLLAVQRGFETISEALSHLRAGPDSPDVTVRASTAVSSLWLTPRLAAFWKVHPDVTVAQMVSDAAVADQRCDLSIEYGPLDSSEDCRLLFQGRIQAVGSPHFAEEKGITALEDLMRGPLIHLNEEETGWTGWRDWFAALGLSLPRGRGYSVNNYVVALQAAQDGMGAVLGWTELVQDHIASGRLVPLVDEEIASPSDFYIRVHPHASDKAMLLCDWLASEAEGA
ncbi:LysR family transcriptional regulator [Salipiger pallidus]|uniref:LysR family transcriptional regulator n=1 Tax=Salipiger pallidus TaxID=1775170 RepID=A0A8J2ZH04_9RHOB|nr:LysR substrate-binding domain-containing protein [Salipiger pallidus]GGG63083.1 LysR family transcriptional regulator [Salipiger pallidus]